MRHAVRPTRRRSTLAGAVLALLAAVLTAFAPPAVAEQQTVVRGGDPLYGGHGYTCRVAYNVERAGEAYGLLLGHCASPVGTTWYADAGRTVPVGETAEATFPGGDRALLRYTNDSVDYPGEISLGGGQSLPLTGATTPSIGAQVCWVSGTSGLRCGVVQALNVSLTYPEGTVTGLVKVAGCVEPGDVGRPAFSGTEGVGIVQGGTGDCSTGGATYLMPLVPLLSAYGIALR